MSQSDSRQAERSAAARCPLLGHSSADCTICAGMLALALVCILVGFSLLISGVVRGELHDQRPRNPQPHWMMVVGAIAFVGGTLLTVVTLAVPRLVPQQEAVNVEQPVASSRGTIEPVSTILGILH